MIGKLAFRSLTAHPIRSGVLAAGFGVGVAVMAILLGVAEIVLDQARSPALLGGGDVIVRLGPLVPARLLLSGTMQTDALRDRVRYGVPLARFAALPAARGPERTGEGAWRDSESGTGTRRRGNLASGRVAGHS